MTLWRSRRARRWGELLAAVSLLRRDFDRPDGLKPRPNPSTTVLR